MLNVYLFVPERTSPQSKIIKCVVLLRKVVDVRYPYVAYTEQCHLRMIQYYGGE